MNKFNLENKIENYIRGKRFKYIGCIEEDIKNCSPNIKDVELNKCKEEKDYISDDFLIGTMIYNNIQYDIEVYYIKDNYENYYITEFSILEEVS